LNKVKIDMMGGLVSINTILDESKKEGLMLMDMMATKKAVKIGKSDFEKGSSQALPKVISSNETQKIAGFSCKKSTLKTEDGQVITIYTSDEIQPKNSSFLQKMVGNLKGFPLGLEMLLPDGGKLKVWAKDIIKKSPDKSEFNLKIPDGYEKTTMEELQKQAGKGGKGLLGN
jgi:outer membrane lipoprotein-sorting protein